MPTPHTIKTDFGGYLILGTLPKRPRRGFCIPYEGGTPADKSNLRLLREAYRPPNYKVTLRTEHKDKPAHIHVYACRNPKRPETVAKLMRYYGIDIPRFTP